MLPTRSSSDLEAWAVGREAQRLDLLAEVARRYLAIVAAQRQTGIAQFDIGQRERTVAEARKRLQAGASPESVVLTAQAALARAELDKARAQQRETAARQHLAALRSEEHTSELQSLMRISYAVFCLNKKNNHHPKKHNLLQPT